MNKSVHGIVFLVLVVLLISTSACLPNSPLTASAPLTVLGTLQIEGSTEVAEARLIIERGKHTIEETVPVLQNSFSATLNVPIGEWEVTVLLVDGQGFVLYQSKPEKTQVSLGQEPVLDLVLRPADSDVHVKIDLNDYVFRHVVMRARIHFNDVVYEVTREDTSTPLEYRAAIAPGSYEFKIELYTESFRIGDRISPGVWDVIHVTEGEELSISWSPATKNFQISGRVETLIPAPKNLVLTSDSESIELSWDPVIHENVMGYFIFAQSSPLERFELLNSSPREELRFLHTVEDDQTSEIHFVVAAVSRSGLVGYFSEPKTWQR